MHPILLAPGGYAIHAYGALAALAFVLGTGVILLRSHRLGLDVSRVADAVFWITVASLAGARLVYVLQHLEEMRSVWSLVDLRGGGLVFYGAFLTGIPAGFVILRRYDVPVLAFWDILATAAPLAHAVSRVGCFLAGCCYGAPTDGPWGVTFPPDSLIAPPGIPLHPVQLYEAGTLLLIALATNLFYGLRRFDGQVFVLYLVLYAAARAVLETFRGDFARGWFLPGVLGPVISFSQGVSVLVALAAIVVFVVGARRAAA